MKLRDLRTKLGPLWWYTLMIFLVQRFGDVINAFIGVWLVPRYVPMEELGSLRPLMQIGALLGMPIGLLVTPYIKLLNTHAARGEHGKVKALLRDAAIFAAVVSPLTLVAARFVMPSAFSLMRITNGRLALVIVVTSILGAVTPIFTEAMRALKRFRSYSTIGLFSAPLRLAALLVAMPIRGLTGYFAGQSTGPLLTIGLSAIDLVRTFGRKIRCESYWKEDRKVFLAYLVPLGIMTVAGNIRGTMEMLLLPSLPAIESAAFYHLSIFSEITTYFLSPMIFVMFPLVAERHEKGEKTRRTLVQTMAVCIGVGIVSALALTWIGKPLFSLADATVFGRRPFGFAAVWKPYVVYTKYFGILALTAGLRMAMSCFGSHELACRRFRYAWYTVPIALFEALLIRLAYRYPQVSGYGAWHLGGVLAIMFVFTLLPLLCAVIDLALSYGRERTASTSSRI